MRELDLVDWRREMHQIYALVRAAESPSAGHALWRRRRDELFRRHPQSPLLSTDPLRRSGLPYWPYDQRLRFELSLLPAQSPAGISLPTGPAEVTRLRRLGSVRLPAPVDAPVDVWWLEQYGAGVFLPLRDGSAGDTSYGGGRYLLDTAKGADLGLAGGRLIIDLNFLYHPSCRYDSAWQCPLAPPANRIEAVINAGERL